MADLPIVCTLSPAAVEARRENLLNALFGRANERTELPKGWRLRFVTEGEILFDIARAVDAERQCCRFISFTVSVEPDGGPITLEMTGPPGTREFLASLLN
jgi:hypothetical protein